MKRRDDGLWYIGSHRIRWLPLAALVAVVALTGAVMVVAFQNRSVDPDTVDCTRAKCVALTFDDGPTPLTDRLLRVLTADDAKAAFFLVGNKVAADPASNGYHLVTVGHLLGPREPGGSYGSRVNGPPAHYLADIPADQIPALPPTPSPAPARNLPITDIPNQNPGGPQ